VIADIKNNFAGSQSFWFLTQIAILFIAS
jgi:hypothetical protein